MTWVGYFEDIEESQIESLEMDNRQLEIIGSNATLNNEESKRYLQHAKCYHEAGQKIEHRLLEIVTHPDYSNVLLLSKNKKLQNELSDSNRVILALREELQKIGQEKDKLLSNLQRLFQENIQLVSQIKSRKGPNHIQERIRPVQRFNQ